MPGYVGNQQEGCRTQVGLCPDGKTVCDVNANCVKRPGVDGYLCEVNIQPIYGDKSS